MIAPAEREPVALELEERRVMQRDREWIMPDLKVES
jgi:hypothetical protein